MNFGFASSLILILALSAEAFGSTINIEIENLRSGEGSIAVSVFKESEKRGFPGKPEKAIFIFTEKLQGRTSLSIKTSELPAGKYAVAVMHDENNDLKLNTFLGAPKEGFGFSNNPKVILGPPSFNKATVDVGAEAVESTIKMKYML